MVTLISWRLHLKRCFCSLLISICSKFVSAKHLISFQITFCLTWDWSSKKVISGFEQQTSIHPRFLFLPPKLSDTSAYFCTFLHRKFYIVGIEGTHQEHVIKWSDELWQFPKSFIQRENWKANQHPFTSSVCNTFVLLSEFVQVFRARVRWGDHYVT